MVPIEPITGVRLEALRALLAQDPVQNMFLLSVLEGFGTGRADGPPFRFLAPSGEGPLKGVLFVGGEGNLLVPAGDPMAAAEIARTAAEQGLKIRSVAGERMAVDQVLRAFGAVRFALERTQRLCTVSADDMGPFVAPQLRTAQMADLDEVVALAAASVKESLGIDATAREGPVFRTRIGARIKAGRTWVMTEGSRIVFKVDMGPRSRYGAELENPYLIPELRGRGLGTLGLGQVCRQQLSAIPRLTLRHDERDPVLSRVCRKVGFNFVRPQRLVVCEA